jgi:ubiquinone/menaquinone biosynthesis C-methylase UbiE
MERVPEAEAIAEMADARRFNAVMGSNRFRQQGYRQLACEAVAIGIPPEGKLLDIGTGPGFVAIEVAMALEGTGCLVVGLDLSPSMLALAAENALEAGVSDMLAWREGNCKGLPFGDNVLLQLYLVILAPSTFFIIVEAGD